jgi:hypothetical protein
MWIAGGDVGVRLAWWHNNPAPYFYYRHLLWCSATEQEMLQSSLFAWCPLLLSSPARSGHVGGNVEQVCHLWREGVS